jgi:peptidyl-prolyl cis-trans isomerase C
MLAMTFSACAKKPSPDDTVIATVSSKDITAGEFKSKIAQMPAYYQKVVDKDRKRYLDEMILEMLLYEEAIRKGVDKDKDVKEVLSEAKKKIVTTKFVKNMVDDKVRITEEEMKSFYESNKNEFRTQPMWRASHILVANEREARDIQAELAKGVATFAELAKTHSIDATASRGGDVGYFRSGQLIPDFEKECLKLEVGQVSDVVHTQFGYHIIKMTDKKEAAVKSFQDARRDIESELKRRKRSELFNGLVSNLKGKYSVKIKEDVFEAMDAAKEKAAK